MKKLSFTKTSKYIFKYLFLSYLFEKKMGESFFSKKRFSLEGCDILLPVLFFIIKIKQNTVISMAHRGRLNVLYNIFNYNFFIHNNQDEIFHLGCSKIKGNKKIIILPNPSHLEYSNCVSMGYTRALIENNLNSLNVQVHGDCSFSGQGIIMETLNLSKLKSYNIKGTMHIIINNSIGFTTSIKNELRSSKNCYDISKMFNIPVFIIDEKDPIGATNILKKAIKYILKKKKDLILNIRCYRKNGHSEQDNPNITHPIEYSIIKNKKPAYKYLESKIPNSIKYKKKILCDFKKKRTCFFIKNNIIKTSLVINKNKIFEVLKKFKNKVKKVNNLHDIVKTFIKKRLGVLKGKKIDWSTGEYLAINIINMLNYKIRFSGQDSQRGAFCQRHYYIYDQKTGKKFCIFNKKMCSIINSPLSEMSTLGYEIGYSFCNCDYNYKTMNIWEAQFGDFINCAQVYIDQYISSAYFKWKKRMNIIILLPHGIEGQGPEHSSARIERIMSLCSKKNISVLYPNSSSQYFNCLVSQINLYKPLLILTKKNVRNKFFESDISDFNGVYKPYKILNRKSKNCFVCVGDIYYEILKYQNSILIIEELYPLPIKKIKKELKKLIEIKKFIWIQNEPKNQGYWPYISRKFRKISEKKIDYIGIKSIPSTTYTGKKFFINKNNMFKRVMLIK
ncbi:thiamine pyrophosphate-dependent enzyme [Candidatus Vidania fulgoroideorum]